MRRVTCSWGCLATRNWLALGFTGRILARDLQNECVRSQPIGRLPFRQCEPLAAEDRHIV